MNPLKRAAMFAALAAFGFALIVNRQELPGQNPLFMVVTVASCALALWGLSGLAVFVGKRVNVVRNWLGTVVVLGLLNVYGNENRRQPETTGGAEASAASPHLRHITLSDGTVQKVEFEREPSASDLAEAKAYFEGFKAARK